MTLTPARKMRNLSPFRIRQRAMHARQRLQLRRGCRGLEVSPEHGRAGVGDHTMNERNEFIARMEASGIAPTWEMIYDLNVTLAALRADLATAERERDQWRFLHGELADTQRRDRERLESATDALRRIYDSRGDAGIGDLQQIAFEGLCDIKSEDK